jgi:hypothetical protein
VDSIRTPTRRRALRALRQGTFAISFTGSIATRALVDEFYGLNNNNIVTPQWRGLVFVACHDSIHVMTRGLHAAPEFSRSSANEIAADLTNSILPDVVLVPSVVAFIAELQRSGYSYAKGS